MSVPLRQSVRMGGYIAKQRLARRDKFPLLVELEPLFQCNLACSFCGKIQHPDHILKQRMPVEQALGAIEECGAPMVSIAGGEPLVHPEVHVIAAELLKRKKFVFLCTNGILLKQKLDNFKPSPYFSWVVHLDGLRERHDQFVEREGVFDKAVDAIREAKAPWLPRQHQHDLPEHDTPETVREVLDYLNDDLASTRSRSRPPTRTRRRPTRSTSPA